MADELSLKHRAFCREYVTDYNATQAYVRAGYSPNGAGESAFKLLKNAEIQDEIQRLEDERIERSQLSDARLIQELERLAVFDARKLYDEEGNIIPLEQIDDDTAASIVGIESIEKFEDGKLVGYIKKYKLADKKGSLETLLKMRGKLVDRRDITSDGKPLQVVVYIPDNTRDTPHESE